jgi:hypothetical protein
VDSLVYDTIVLGMVVHQQWPGKGRNKTLREGTCWFAWARQEETDVNELAVFVILATVIAYLAIRLIVFWNASRTSRRRDR